jgi:hypothetical protein
MTSWNIIAGFGSGDLIETVDGTLSQAKKRRHELKKEHGSGLIISAVLE